MRQACTICGEEYSQGRCDKCCEECMKKDQKKKTCGNCEYLNRWKWHSSLGGGYRKGGDCEILTTMLKNDNPRLVFVDKIYVYESFGCIFFKASSLGDI